VSSVNGFDLAGARVVVTGAGNGIGAAMAARFANAGARVVVNDIDADAAVAVANRIGGFAIPGDASSPSGPESLVAAAREHLEAIDLFCANAGVGTPGGPEALDEAWDLAWQVNVMAHVRAARALLPDWLERGKGRLLATVSAAGLLTMLGSAPYSVTKHGALAFAEWMSITYRDRGIITQALCPQGVRTAMLDSAGEVGRLLMDETAIEPDDVASSVITALAGDEFLILPHPEIAKYYAYRAAEPDRWGASMAKLQAQVSRVDRV
jgi:NAD(P)-dependent dehydrogenase (short-subunit alcohol dehydrogenase family)